MTGAFGPSNAKPVSGIGESAIEYSTTGNANTAGMAIYVVKSNGVLMIAIQRHQAQPRLKSWRAPPPAGSRALHEGERRTCACLSPPGAYVAEFPAIGRWTIQNGQHFLLKGVTPAIPATRAWLDKTSFDLWYEPFGDRHPLIVAI
jgi:hypothetical protein